MTLEELRTELKGILALEEQQPVDWPVVEARCLNTICSLNTEMQPRYPHDVVYQFLDDPDVRQKDFDYGEVQRHRLKGWLSESG